MILAILIGFLAGLANRYLFDAAAERDVANSLRSGLHGAGIALTVWMVQSFFAVGARSGLGAALRRLPVAADVVIRSLVMALAVVAVGVLLQFILYADSSGRRRSRRPGAARPATANRSAYGRTIVRASVWPAAILTDAVAARARRLDLITGSG